jgi:hypothetical protein
MKHTILKTSGLTLLGVLSVSLAVPGPAQSFNFGNALLSSGVGSASRHHLWQPLWREGSRQQHPPDWGTDVQGTLNGSLLEAWINLGAARRVALVPS